MTEDSPPLEKHHGLKPPQFGLTTLFWGLGLLAILLTIFRGAGPIAAFATGLLMLAIMAHVAGNALGGQLRSLGSHTIDSPSDTAIHFRQPRNSQLNPTEFAPPTRLRQQTKMGRIMTLLTGGGAIVAAVAGAKLLIETLGQSATASNIGFGTLSFGVLGGLWGFGASRFLQVFIDAWWQAHRAADGDCAKTLDSQDVDKDLQAN